MNASSQTGSVEERTLSDLPPLGAHERKETGLQLQATLVELVDLSLLGKQLHWNVVGPLFRPLHLHLDELIDSWRELSDTVAERAVAIGFPPDAQARTVASDSPLEPVAPGAIEDHVVVETLTRRLAQAAERIRTEWSASPSLTQPPRTS